MRKGVGPGWGRRPPARSFRAKLLGDVCSGLMQAFRSIALVAFLSKPQKGACGALV